MATEVQCAALEAAADELLRVMLRLRVGAQAAPPSAESQLFEKVEQQRFREWVLDLQLQYKTALKEAGPATTGDTDAGSDDDDEKIDGVMQDASAEQLLLDLIDQRKLELREISLERARESNLVERMRTTAITSRAMFPDETVDDDSPMSAEEMASISARVNHRDTLSSKLLHTNKELAGKRDELADVRRRNKSLINQNREMLANLKEQQKMQNDGSVFAAESQQSQASEALTREMQRNSILRNTFQALIVGSGVDWGSDADLQATLLDLSQTPQV